MKQKYISILTILIFSGIVTAQGPTGNPPTTNSVNILSGSAWYRGGNYSGGQAGSNNIFGTMTGFNSSIYVYTNGIQ